MSALGSRLRGGAAIAVCFAIFGSTPAEPKGHPPSEIAGTWRGTSLCTDLKAAPACKDEVIVYDFTAGKEPDAVHWLADKVVDGKRQTMGESDMRWDAAEGCWAMEFESPRAHIKWCLKVEGTHMTGTGRLLPGNEVVRKVDARKD